MIIDDMNEETTRKVLELLKSEESVLNEIYGKYGDKIKKNQDKYLENAKTFRVRKPLTVYSSMSKVMTDSNTTIYDLRFRGQSVGEVKVSSGKNSRTLSVNEDQAKRAKEKFDFKDSEVLTNVGWLKPKAVAFRRFYTNLVSTKGISIHSREHRIESLLLSEFAKTKSLDKQLQHIQPIRLGNKYFQLRTPLAASNHKEGPQLGIRRDKQGVTGGGIDILARVTHSDNKRRIAIIELKDENTKKEPQKIVMLQALAYATFVAFLLRSESGKTWWNIFRDQELEKNVPDKLHLDVVTLMPFSETTDEGKLGDIELEGLNTTLHLYKLYYDLDKDDNPNNFNGTFPDSLMKKK